MRKFLFIISFILGLLMSFVGYIYCKFHVGDTWGLYDKLRQIDGVTAVDNYVVRDGNASFTLILNEGSLSLANIGNTDLTKSDGIMIESVGAKRINCKKKGTKVWALGVTALSVQKQFLLDSSLSVVDDLVLNYSELETLFSSSSLLFTYPSREDSNLSEKWLCELK